MLLGIGMSLNNLLMWVLHLLGRQYLNLLIIVGLGVDVNLWGSLAKLSLLNNWLALLKEVNKTWRRLVRERNRAVINI